MRLSTLAAGLLSLSLAAAMGCSSTDPAPSGTGGTTGTGGGSGTGGSTGGTTGTGGSTGGTTGSGGAGGSSNPDASGPFTAVEPCTTAADYTEATTVNFSGLAYMPKCLKVKAGTDVKFTGMFTTHPLTPSKKRGDMTDNPIVETKTGTEVTFKFAKAGNFSYYCAFHGAGDDGKFMVGNVWVTP